VATLPREVTVGAIRGEQTAGVPRPDVELRRDLFEGVPLLQAASLSRARQIRTSGISFSEPSPVASAARRRPLLMWTIRV